MSEKVCKGCGVAMQDSDMSLPGYAKQVSQEYCQRCFRLRHYDDVTYHVEQGESDQRIYETIRNMDCLVIWVVDLFDFEGSMISGLARHIGKKDVLMVGTKRDLLPSTLSNQKLEAWLKYRLREEQITIRGIAVSAHHGKDGIDGVMQAIKILGSGRPVVFMGVANAGKSTLINAILRNDTITTSRYPGTTIDLMHLDSELGELYDTPGIKIKTNIVHYVDSKELKKIVPQKALKPRNYQLYEPQSLAVGGIARLDLPQGVHTTVTCYFNDLVPIHRGKLERSDVLWSTHYGGLLQPVCTQTASFDAFVKYDFAIKEQEKTDIMIHGFGWFCIVGHKQVITIHVPKLLGVSKSKARI